MSAHCAEGLTERWNTFLGLRTVIYPTSNLAGLTAWFRNSLGVEPYFSEPYYVGFSVGGDELGIDPEADQSRGPVTYWGTLDCASEVASLVEAGATLIESPRDVGQGITVAIVELPHGGGAMGLITNPHSPVTGSHRSRVATICIDVPASKRALSEAFWSGLLGGGVRQGEAHPEYSFFGSHQEMSYILQATGDDEPRIHLDVHTDDVAAETQRLIGLGAKELARVDDWVVLQDPAGNVFCVVPDDDGERLSRAARWEH